MFDMTSRASAAPASPPFTAEVEFYTIELARLQDGNIVVGLTATSFDEQEPQLLDQEIAAERVATIDDALALVRASVVFS
jgi:hypothetical protein